MARNKLIVAVHDGNFHPDEVFGVAVIKLCYESNYEIEVVRTRDETKIEAADIVLDVGGEHDPNRRRFDHHQTGGAGERENGIPYASFGLVWKEYGEKVTGSAEVTKMIDGLLVQPIDAEDNSLDLVEPKIPGVYPYSIRDFIKLHRPSWKNNSPELQNAGFMKALSVAQEILRLEIVRVSDLLEAKAVIIDTYKNSADKEVLILDQYYPYDAFVGLLPKTKFIIHRRPDNTWVVGVKAVEPHSFKSVVDFPKEWGGKRDDELAEITGVPDAVFCHRALFMVVAKTKEGALELAQKALKSK